MKRSMRRYQQYAALPVRFEAGHLQVLLLTSRDTGRWLIPKGWPMRRLRPAAAAALEAYEEAGLEGTIEDETPIGHYHYDKGLPNGRTATVLVDVFLLTVSRQLAAWPEQAERERRWYDPDTAAGLVAEPELAAILRGVTAKAGCPKSLIRAAPVTEPGGPLMAPVERLFATSSPPTATRGVTGSNLASSMTTLRDKASKDSA